MKKRESKIAEGGEKREGVKPGKYTALLGSFR